MKIIVVLLLLMVSLYFSSFFVTETPDNSALPVLNIDTHSISVSGVSSGGYMANQYHVAHSRYIIGSGIISAGPYNCAANSTFTAMSRCMGYRSEWFGINLDDTTVNFTKKLASKKLIDDPSHMENDKVWIFHGMRDEIIKKPITDDLVEYYKNFIDETNLVYIDDIDAPHGMITDQSNDPCGSSAHPWVNDCDFDSAGALLKHIYGNLDQRVTADGITTRFSQSDFTDNAAHSGLAEHGYVYIPNACDQGEKCRLHIAFHGCRQGESFVDTKYVKDGGYNEWAEANKIIILYPQIADSYIPFNPNGCWDWWGYTDEHYLDHQSLQMTQIQNMIKKISGTKAL